MQRLLGLGLLVTLLACGNDKPIAPELDASIDSAISNACDTNADCDDGVYCNGIESCDASHANADPVTHCVDGAAVVCTDNINCTLDRCDEPTKTCKFNAPDDDNDGHDDANCLADNNEPLGDDCDDSDDTRYTGNTEVCTPGNSNATLDEDCDETTFGDRDTDNDSHEDIRCCNPDSTGTQHCGDDCNDSDMTVYPSAGEICDDQDNDCDNIDDESPINAEWYPDLDGDQYGNPTGTPMTSCAPISGYSTVATDCDDTLNTVNPGNAEACDGIDNNCNNTMDEGLMCGSGVCTVACGPNAQCAGNNVCVCVNGYVSSGGSCVDVNECVTDTDGCDASPDACVNTVGGFMCVCPNGYMGNGMGSVGCEDIDECATNNGGCGSALYWTCGNQLASAPTCTDVDECATNNGGCDTTPDACVNTVDGFTCACPIGYMGDGVGTNGCQDVDECAGTNVCTVDYPCQNLALGYTCRGQFADWPPAYSSTAFTLNGDGTVTDSRSGLLWQQSDSPGHPTWVDAKDYCTNLALVGTGWRLPTKAELESIVDDTTYSYAIDGTVFLTSSGADWSSSPYVSQTGHAWYVAFDNGGSEHADTSNGPGTARCVRSSAVVVASSGTGGAPPGRYTYPASGTVYDTRTMLTWQQTAAPSSYRWAAAQMYCTALALAGSGWRLPTRAELLTLVDPTQANPAIDPTAFPSAALGYFWTSSELVAAGTGTWWGVSFYDGRAGVGGDSSVSNSVRCVR